MFEIRDQSGRLLETVNLVSKSNSTRISTANLGAGMFLGILKDDNGTIEKLKFVIEK